MPNTKHVDRRVEHQEFGEAFLIQYYVLTSFCHSQNVDKKKCHKEMCTFKTPPFYKVEGRELYGAPRTQCGRDKSATHPARGRVSILLVGDKTRSHLLNE